MQLEQTLEIYRPIQRTQERQRGYTVVDLESFSASALYNSGPFGGSGPLGCGLGGGSIFDKMDKFASSRPLEFKPKGMSYKIIDPELKIHLLRLDLDSHHRKPAPHLQYGKTFFTERTGNEAADMLAEILRRNSKIKWPL